jgi:hypothetical protein
LIKLAHLQKIGVLPLDVGVHEVMILHDDWCGMFTGKRCNCDPHIRLAWTQPDSARN